MFRVALRSRLVAGRLWLWALVGCGAGCSPKVRGDASIPAPVLYRADADFSGLWEGYVGGHHGVLRLEQLREGEYGGNFVGDDPTIQFALVARQDRLRRSAASALSPSNRLMFEWQDGGRSQGRGWLLISLEGRALTGEFGFGETAIGGGLWNFVRHEEGGAKSR